ncbi:hypothetical protein TeGR_g888, partial [Tetraparma gracilis]
PSTPPNNRVKTATRKRSKNEIAVADAPAKKIVGMFPPRRNSLSQMPASLKEKLGENKYSVGGYAVKVEVPVGGGEETKAVEVAVPPAPDPGVTPLNTPAVALGKGGGAAGQRKKARQTDMGETKEKLKMLGEAAGEGPVEEPERRAARETDMGATAARLQALNVGEGPVEEPERKQARITDSGETAARLQALNVGEGPVEEPERKQARITDSGETAARLQALNVGEGPVEEPERKQARITDSGETAARLQALNVGEGPTEQPERRAARETDMGATAARLQALNVGEGPTEQPERRAARETDMGATAARLQALNVGEGPTEQAERRGARETDAGFTAAMIQTLEGAGPDEEPEPDTHGGRRPARQTDFGHTEKTMAMLSKLHAVGEGPEEEPEKREAVTELRPSMLEKLEGIGEGPQEVAERKQARITDGGATAAALSQLSGEGPQEVPERRAARETDMGATAAKIQALNVGEGPKEYPERRAARETDMGATAAKIHALNVGEGPKETPERRAARETDFGATAAKIQALNVGEGPAEQPERKQARITDFGATSEALTHLVGTGPEELQPAYTQPKTHVLTIQPTLHDNQLKPSPRQPELENTHVQFTDDGGNKNATAPGALMFSPNTKPSFHVPPDEVALPNVGLDDYWGQEPSSLGSAGAGRPETAPANIDQHAFTLPRVQQQEAPKRSLFGRTSPGGMSSTAGSAKTTQTAQVGASLDSLRVAAIPKEEKERQRLIKKQRENARIRTVTNPFGVARPGVRGASFGPRHNYVDDDVGKASGKRSGGKGKEKWFYDRHGRRHRIGKKKVWGEREEAGEDGGG